MMSTHMRRGITYLFSQNSSYLCKVHVSLSSYFATSANNPDLSESLTQKYHLHPQVALDAASFSSTLENPKKSDSILSFFIESGFSTTQMEKIVKSSSRLLSMNLDKIIKPKYKIFQDFGYSTNEIAEIILKDPLILHSSAEKRIIPSLSFLKDLLGSTDKVIEFSKISGWYLRCDLENCLLPNINLLTSCGVSMEKIFWLMYYFPRFILQNPKSMERYVKKADKLGADRNSKMYLHSVRIVGSMRDDTWELKMKAFRDLGFSEDDIHQVFRLQPQVFAISVEKIKKVKDIILATGKYDMSCIIRNPSSLSRSIEKSYKPRIRVLEILEGKNLITSWPSFSTLCKMTERSFFERYVSPYYDEVGEVYMVTRTLIGK